jgi:Cu2+-exporting ATPase
MSLLVNNKKDTKMDHSHHPNHNQHSKNETIAESTEQKAGQNHHLPDKDDKHDLHDKHAGHHTENFLKRFWICLILTIPVLLLSHMVQQWFGFHI